jgi:hypothetical protein
MFFVRELDSNYSEIETGFISEKSFEDFVKANQLEIIERNEKTATVRAEWGNGEGYDTFEIEFSEEESLNDAFFAGRVSADDVFNQMVANGKRQLEQLMQDDEDAADSEN